jgi:hypothetical protein
VNVAEVRQAVHTLRGWNSWALLTGTAHLAGACQDLLHSYRAFLAAPLVCSTTSSSYAGSSYAGSSYAGSALSSLHVSLDGAARGAAASLGATLYHQGSTFNPLFSAGTPATGGSTLSSLGSVSGGSSSSGGNGLGAQPLLPSEQLLAGRAALECLSRLSSTGGFSASGLASGSGSWLGPCVGGLSSSASVPWQHGAAAAAAAAAADLSLSLASTAFSTDLDALTHLVSEEVDTAMFTITTETAPNTSSFLSRAERASLAAAAAAAAARAAGADEAVVSAAAAAAAESAAHATRGHASHLAHPPIPEEELYEIEHSADGGVHGGGGSSQQHQAWQQCTRHAGCGAAAGERLPGELIFEMLPGVDDVGMMWASLSGSDCADEAPPAGARALSPYRAMEQAAQQQQQHDRSFGWLGTVGSLRSTGSSSLRSSAELGESTAAAKAGPDNASDSLSGSWAGGIKTTGGGGSWDWQQQQQDKQLMARMLKAQVCVRCVCGLMNLQVRSCLQPKRMIVAACLPGTAPCASCGCSAVAVGAVAAVAALRCASPRAAA